MKLSVIIVNYNVKNFLEQCLKSVEKALKGFDAEIFVVDNNSIDKSIEMVKEHFPNVKLICNDTNVGFSKANNQAIVQSIGEYVLLLNPDTIIQENTLNKTLDFLDQNPKAGALGVKMIDGSGNFLPESKRSLPTPSSAFYKIFGLSSLFPKSKEFGKYHLNYLDQDEIHEIDVISGAFFMIRKVVLNKIGLLDESFFMYGEDIDLSYRIQKAGYTNYYLPTTSIIHYKGESTKKTSINYVFTFYNAMMIFVKKHYKGSSSITLLYLIKIAIIFRAFISIKKRFIKNLILPIIDSIAIYSIMFFLKDFWSKKYFMNEHYYNSNMIKIAIPFYILFWITGIYLQSGYKKNSSIKSIANGMLIGTIILLIFYALLPDSLRFSRALIILGFLFSTLALIFIRQIIKFLFYNKKIINKRVGIVADQYEYKRIYQILNLSKTKTNIIGLINTNKYCQSELGNVKNLEEIINIYQLNEIIFSTKNINSNQLIEYMEKIRQDVFIKIAPSESTFIIGSNSIHNKQDFYSLKNSIHKKQSIKTIIKKYIDFFN